MKKFNIILLTVILTVILLIVEVLIVKNISRYEPELTVIYAKSKIPENTVIQGETLQEKKVGISAAHKYSIKNARDIIGRRSKIDIEEGEMMLTSKLYEANELEEIKVMDKNSRLFSIEFKADQANGWQLRSGQYVDIIFIPNNNMRIHSIKQSGNQNAAHAGGFEQMIHEVGGGVQRIKDIRIAALIDDKGKLIKNSGRDTLPRYISFEVTNQQDEFLAFAKGNGRLEVSVIP
jgi:Flp pilus assembly protein CpaB